MYHTGFVSSVKKLNQDKVKIMVEKKYYILNQPLLFSIGLAFQK